METPWSARKIPISAITVIKLSKVAFILADMQIITIVEFLVFAAIPRLSFFRYRGDRSDHM